MRRVRWWCTKEMAPEHWRRQLCATTVSSATRAVPLMARVRMLHDAFGVRCKLLIGVSTP